MEIVYSFIIVINLCHSYLEHPLIVESIENRNNILGQSSTIKYYEICSYAI